MGTSHESRLGVVGLASRLSQGKAHCLGYFPRETLKTKKNEKITRSSEIFITLRSPHCLKGPVRPTKFNEFSGSSEFIEVD